MERSGRNCAHPDQTVVVGSENERVRAAGVDDLYEAGQLSKVNTHLIDATAMLMA